jgi:Ser/Thr protein kinase RdoA (MazF antagonist)
MVTTSARQVLSVMGISAVRVRAIAATNPDGNANWHVWRPERSRAVLRRYYNGMSAAELDYEHQVLGYVRGAGWKVPRPLSEPVCHAGRWWCLTEYVPGRARPSEGPAQRAQRGVMMARLDQALRPLSEELGQRQGWQASHEGPTPLMAWDWQGGLRALGQTEPRLADWFAASLQSTRAELARVGCAALPMTVVHGDLASWNIHFQGQALVGVIDFALAHLDSRPYELAMARTYRAPEALDTYRQEMKAHGWPLTDLEEESLTPVYRSFRVGMAAWALDAGLRKGAFDHSFIESQLERTGVVRP